MITLRRTLNGTGDSHRSTRPQCHRLYVDLACLLRQGNGRENGDQHQRNHAQQRVAMRMGCMASWSHESLLRRPPSVALEMVSSRTFDGRLQLLEYVPRVLAGPPGATASD